MDVLYIYTLYDHPRDLPDYWVIKRWIISPSAIYIQDPDYIELHKELQAAYDSMLKRGLYRLQRSPEDDPVIHCTFI